MIKNIRLLSPDGFDIERDTVYRSLKQARIAFEKWITKYQAQGYYSSSRHGKIALKDIINYCQLIK